jgi:hypothetical protein
MARNFAQRLDRLERLAAALLSPETSPVYLRHGDPIPEEVNSERVVFIVRTFIDPPECEEKQLPEIKWLTLITFALLVTRFNDARATPNPMDLVGPADSRAALTVLIVSKKKGIACFAWCKCGCDLPLTCKLCKPKGLQRK